jgi:hypothetical protein
MYPKKKTKLHGLSTRANYTDRATGSMYPKHPIVNNLWVLKFVYLSPLLIFRNKIERGGMLEIIYKVYMTGWGGGIYHNVRFLRKQWKWKESLYKGYDYCEANFHLGTTRKILQGDTKRNACENCMKLWKVSETRRVREQGVGWYQTVRGRRELTGWNMGFSRCSEMNILLSYGVIHLCRWIQLFPFSLTIGTKFSYKTFFTNKEIRS